MIYLPTILWVVNWQLNNESYIIHIQHYYNKELKIIAIYNCYFTLLLLSVLFFFYNKICKHTHTQILNYFSVDNIDHIIL